MSTIRANPTAPIAMPILAPVLRPLESLETVISPTVVLLADDDEAVEVEVGATVWLTRPGGVVEDELSSVGIPGSEGSGFCDVLMPSAAGIGVQAVVKSCEVADSLAQIMSNSYVLKGSVVNGTETTAKEPLSVLELQSVSPTTHEKGVGGTVTRVLVGRSNPSTPTKFTLSTKTSSGETQRTVYTPPGVTGEGCIVMFQDP
jgi:hypothetical protein